MSGDLTQTRKGCVLLKISEETLKTAVVDIPTWILDTLSIRSQSLFNLIWIFIRAAGLFKSYDLLECLIVNTFPELPLARELSRGEKETITHGALKIPVR